MKRKTKVKDMLRKIPIYVVLIILSLVTIFPMYWMIGNSLKTTQDFFRDDLMPTLNPTFDWYFEVTDPKVQGLNIFQAYFNTVLYFAITAPLVALLAAMTGFALSYYSFRGKLLSLAYFLIGISIPPQVPLITIYVYYRILGLYNTVPGLILLYLASGIPFNTFLLYSYFRQVPKDLFECATIDGASDVTMFFYIALPVCRPMFYVSLILHGIWVWNEYVLAYSMLPTLSLRTVTPVAATTLGAGLNPAWQIPMALSGLTLVLVPIIAFYIAMNKKIIQGFIQGALGKF